MDRIIFSLLCQYSVYFHPQDIINSKVLVLAGDFYHPNNGFPGRAQSHFGGWTGNESVQIARKNRNYLLCRHTLHIF